MTFDDAPRTYNPQMVRLARLSRGFTQKELASRAGIGQGTLSRIESGIDDPVAEKQLPRICIQLDYPESFFTADEQVNSLGLPEFYHARKRKSVPMGVLKQAYARIAIQRIQVERLLRSFPIDTQFPYFPLSEYEYGSPADIARTLRAQMEILPGPIADMTATVERWGAIVATCPFESTQIDGFSRWRPLSQPPLFFMSRDLPTDRWRWTLAHELGHVVMHTNQFASVDMEDEANQFAQEFLMPERLIGSHLNNLSLPKLAGLKTYWKVSMQALIYRAFSLRRITDRQKRRLYTQLSAGGYRRREPPELDPPPEPPATLKAMVEFHRRDLGYSVAKLAKLLLLNEPEFLTMYHTGSKGRLRIVN